MWLRMTLIAVLLAAGHPVAGAAYERTIITVDTYIDGVDANPADGLCRAANTNLCSLRAAVQLANALPGPDVITVPAGQYLLTILGANEDGALTGDLDILDDLVVIGAGAQSTWVNGIAQDRIFHVLSGTVSITGLDVQSGYSYAGGGGIFNAGTLALEKCVIQYNQAEKHYSYMSALQGGGGIHNTGSLTMNECVVAQNTSTTNYGGNTATYGGGIYNSGILTITRSAVQGNRTTDSVILNGGGGIFNQTGGVLYIRESTVSSNTAGTRSGYGGGIDNGGLLTIVSSTVRFNFAFSGGGIFGGSTAIVGSTISDNRADGLIQEGPGLSYGGGIAATGELTITNSTISGNSTSGHGGGISTFDEVQLEYVTVVSNTADDDQDNVGDGGGVSGSIRGAGSIIALNVDRSPAMQAPDCAGGGVSHGFNLIGNSRGCVFATAVGDQVGAPGNLIDPGLGPLQDNGGLTFTHQPRLDSPVIDAGGAPACPPIDQRGVPRPLGSACDIGAVEAEQTFKKHYFPAIMKS